MKCILEFLIISLKTLDGIRDSAKNYLLSINRFKYKPESDFDKMKRYLLGQEHPQEKEVRKYVSDDGHYP